MTTTRGAVNTVLEGKLYQRGNMLKWPLKQKEDLFQQYGITAVVNLWSKVDPDQSHPSRIYINYPITSKKPHGPTATSIARVVAGLIRSGHVVLVHCEAGRNRSVWFCIRVLHALGGVTPTAAYEQVMEAVPGAGIRPELLDDLATLET